MAFEHLLIDIADQVAVVTINRPRAFNALNAEVIADLIAAFGQIAEHPEVKAVVLTGAGDKAFVAGADISAMQGMEPVAAREFAHLGHRLASTIQDLPKPVIAAVNGYALGGGCELAMACDIRIAGENARFGQPEVNLGVIPGFGGTQHLPRLVGKGRALELILTGEMIDAREAWRIGLVNHVAAPEELLSTARKIAKQIAGKGRVAVRLAKSAIVNGVEMDLERGCRYEADLFALCFATDDQKEGMQAFLQKRQPRFSSH